MKTTPDEPKNKDNLNIDDKPKSEDNLKWETTSKMKMVPTLKKIPKNKDDSLVTKLAGRSRS